MLKQRIEQDYIAAFKAKDSIKKNLLSVVKSAIQSMEKNLIVSDLPDTKVQEILNSVCKGLKETITKSDGEAKVTAQRELSIVQEYLPKEMTEAEIAQKIEELKGKGVCTVPEIMKAFQGLSVDRKLVAKMI